MLAVRVRARIKLGKSGKASNRQQARDDLGGLMKTAVQAMPTANNHAPRLNEQRQEFGIKLTPDPMRVWTARLIQAPLVLLQVKQPLKLVELMITPVQPFLAIGPL